MSSIRSTPDKPGSGKPSSGTEKRQRPGIVGFRATAEERAQIDAAAERAGLTVGSYVRSCALKRPETRAVRRPPVETAQLAKLLGMVGVLCGQVQLLQRQHGSPGAITPAQFEETVAALREAAAAILLVMGKRPRLSKSRAP
jgi:hypothetical protein